MFEKITGYTDKMEMLKKTNVINAGSSKLVSLTGKMEEKITMEDLKKGWRSLNFEVRKRSRLDMSEFKRLFTETYAVLSEMSAADSVRKDCVAMIAEAYLFANTENRELNDSGMPAFVLTERMLNNCVFSSMTDDCNISNVYLIEEEA